MVHAASFTGTLAPGALFSLFGSNLATATTAVSTAPWPSTVEGTGVTINDRPAPLYFISPNQINGQVPY